MRIPLIGQPTAFGQATPAQSLFLAQVSRPVSNGASRRKQRIGARKAKRAAPRRSSAKRAAPRRGKARLVKGSAAAKAYMAKIRRKRRR